MGGHSDIKLIVDGKRVDGRGLYDLRKPLKLSVGVLKNATGSALIHWGGNKILVGVYGPKEVLPKHIENPYRGIVRCYYNMSTFASIEGHGRSAPSRRSIELSEVIGQALEGIIRLDQLPGKAIEVFIIVLQAEGGTRVASLTAAVAALADAGIPLKTMAAGMAVGKADDEIVVDIGKAEDNFGQADMPIAITKDGDILLLQMDGMMTKEEITKALDLAYEKMETLFELQRKAIEEKYSKPIKNEIDL